VALRPSAAIARTAPPRASVVSPPARLRPTLAASSAIPR